MKPSKDLDEQLREILETLAAGIDEGWLDDGSIADAITDIMQLLATHTTKLLNEQLDRIEERYTYGLIDDPNYPNGKVEELVIPLSSIENERKE